MPSTGGGEISIDPAANFTPRAQQVLALARKEAERLHHGYVGTEHLLLGLIRLGQGTAVTVLGRLGLDLETVRANVEKMVGSGPAREIVGNIPYTPRVKKIIALATKEARALHHSYIGTEHILLGLLREGEGLAAGVLQHFGVDAAKARVEILKELDPNIAPSAEGANALEGCEDPDCSKPHMKTVNTRKRYDVYCWEKSDQVVVYRNALFKGRTKLLPTREHDFGSEFLELEQSNGHRVFLSVHSVIKFCEHGAEIIGERIPPSR